MQIMKKKEENESLQGQNYQSRKIKIFTSPSTSQILSAICCVQSLLLIVKDYTRVIKIS